jgi:hypothetical protein
MLMLWGMTNGYANIPAYLTWQGPQIPVWQRTATVKHGYLEYGMLDTFDNHIQAQADTNITIAIMTIEQYAILRADVFYGLNHPYNTTAFYNGTNINFWFNQSEGCSVYIYIIYRNDHTLRGFNVTMNATAIYNPAKNLTGVCGRWQG